MSMRPAAGMPGRLAILGSGIALALSHSGTVALAEDGLARGDTSGKRIAFSNSYAGSSFRQVMVKSWQEVAAQARKDRLIGLSPVVSANNSVAEQATHIQDMILQGYDAIVILAGSDTALNGVVKDACNAGIVVLSLASVVTEDCAYNVNYDWSAHGKAEIAYIAERLKGKGNLLEIRGILGDSTDKDISDGIHAAARNHPGLKIVKTVYGQWTAAVSQKEVTLALPALPQIDAVVDQGGDGYGAALAFKAAGRALPIIIMGNRQDELALWKREHEANGYETFSISATPTVSQVGFWVAQQILAGKKVPKRIEVPLLSIDQDSLDDWLRTMPEGGAATPFYTQELVAGIIDANINHTPLPPTPAPR